jgi:hypothetical protein
MRRTADLDWPASRGYHEPLTKLKTVKLALLVVGMIAFGGGLRTQHTAVGQPAQIAKAKAQGTACASAMVQVT